MYIVFEIFYIMFEILYLWYEGSIWYLLEWGFCFYLERNRTKKKINPQYFRKLNFEDSG